MQSKFLAKLHKSYTVSYRTVGFFALYGFLALFFAVPVVMAYYALSTSWVTPIVLSPSDPASLDLRAKVLESQASMSTLAIDCERLKQSITEMTNHRASLQLLAKQLSPAIQREQTDNFANGEELTRLDSQKKDDNVATGPVITQATALRQTLDKELAAGLITKAEYSATILQLQSASNSFTDGKIAEVLIRDQVRSRATVDTLHLETLSKQTELQSEIANLSINIAIAEKTWRAECEQVTRLKTAIDTAKRTPQYRTFEREAAVITVFMPYHTDLKPGSQIIDCYFKAVGCYSAGTVEEIFEQEVHGNNPILRTDVRGVLVSIRLNPKHTDAAQARVLYTSKPMGF